MSVLLLTGPKPPGRPVDLIDRCGADWEPGSRMRQIRCQSLAQFLRHCVQREQFPCHWLPPTDLSDHVGRDPAGGEARGDAIRLLAELDLRQGELLHLSVRTDRSTSVPHWWCSYRKRSGGGITEPRRIYPLPLQDEGKVVSWHLLERWKARLIQLPPLQSGNGAADGTQP